MANKNRADGHTWIATISGVVTIVVAVLAYFGIPRFTDFWDNLGTVVVTATAIVETTVEVTSIPTSLFSLPIKVSPSPTSIDMVAPSKTPTPTGTPILQPKAIYTSTPSTSIESQRGDETNQGVLPIVETGNLAENSFVDYRIPGDFNTPILITIQVSGVDYRVQIFDSKGFQVVESGTYGSGTQNIPFTPFEDSEYVIRLVGRSNSGNYVLKIDYLCGKPSTRNIVTPLEIDNTVKGCSAVGAFEDFNFEGFFNTPMLLTFQVSGLDYRVKLFDAKQILLQEWGTYGGGTQNIPFTPQKDAKYTVRIVGRSGHGTYTFGTSYVSGDPSQTNILSSLDITTSQEGSLAVSAFKQYLFSGEKNTPLLLTLQVDGFDYRIQVFDDRNLLIKEWGTYGSGTINIPFTPSDTMTYVLKIVGRNGYGRYMLSLDYISGEPEKRNHIRSLSETESVNGSLAIGAYDDFQFDSAANQSALFTVQVSGFDYRIIVFDSKDNIVLEEGTYGSGTREVVFTPPLNGTYRLRIFGREGYGTYVVAMNLK